MILLPAVERYMAHVMFTVSAEVVNSRVTYTTRSSNRRFDDWSGHDFTNCFQVRRLTVIQSTRKENSPFPVIQFGNFENVVGTFQLSGRLRSTPGFP